MFIFFFFPLSGSGLYTQFSFSLIFSWLLWLAHFLDFFPPLHFSASFNLPHSGVILERSFAGACLLAFSPFCSHSSIIKCKYQHTLMFCGPEAQSCIPVCLSVSFYLTLHLYVMCTPNYQSLCLITDNIPRILSVLFCKSIILFSFECFLESAFCKVNKLSIYSRHFTINVSCSTL